jgi:hypothetical protein
MLTVAERTYVRKRGGSRTAVPAECTIDPGLLGSLSAVKLLFRTGAVSAVLSASAPFVVIAILAFRVTWPSVARRVTVAWSAVNAELQEWRP